jgi:hypothetical protein
VVRGFCKKQPACNSVESIDQIMSVLCWKPDHSFPLSAGRSWGENPITQCLTCSLDAYTLLLCTLLQPLLSPCWSETCQALPSWNLHTLSLDWYISFLTQAFCSHALVSNCFL